MAKIPSSADQITRSADQSSRTEYLAAFPTFKRCAGKSPSLVRMNFHPQCGWAQPHSILSRFSGPSEKQNPPAVRVSHPHYHPHSTNSQKLNKETWSQCGWDHPQCGSAIRTGAAEKPNLHDFNTVSIFGTSWTRFTAKCGQGILGNNPDIAPTNSTF